MARVLLFLKNATQYQLWENIIPGKQMRGKGKRGTSSKTVSELLHCFPQEYNRWLL